MTWDVLKESFEAEPDATFKHWLMLKAAIDAEPMLTKKVLLQQEWNQWREALEENTDEA